MSVDAIAPPKETARALGIRCVAIVVHYLDASQTLQCIESLRGQCDNLEILIIDNASPDGSGREVADAIRSFDDVTLLTAWQNGGFGAGCNFAFAHATQRWPRAEHVLLINPDARLADGSLAQMRELMSRRSDAGIVGCRIDDEDGNCWYENGRVPNWTLSGCHVPAPGGDEYRADFVTGACMLIRGELMRAGLRFDESFFLYCEDMDLSCEVKSWGFQLWVTQRARAVHRGGGSQPGKQVLGELTAERLRWLTRAKVLFARKRLRPLQRVAFFATALVAKPLAGLLTQLSPRFLSPYLRGFFAGLVAPRRGQSTDCRWLTPTGRSRS